MDNIITCIIIMIFTHIVDDYYLQGILASMKQKDWWLNNSNYNEKYKHDYKWALLMHAFSWSFMIMAFPLYIFNLSFDMIEILTIFLSNILIHSVVDNMKANQKKINLVQDQLIHICQIIITALIICYVIV